MRRVLEKYRYPILFILIFLLSWVFPYTGDDWAWGGQIGLDRLQQHFVDYGGRYLGYFIVMAMTRSVVVKSLVMAFCNTGIVYLIEKITGNRHAFYLVLFLLLMMPKEVWIQGVVWSSGYANYGTTIFLTLLYIRYLSKELEAKDEAQTIRHPIRDAVLLFLLGVANTLIVENITLYHLGLSILIILWVLLRDHKIKIQYIFYTIGCAIGTVVMFSNSAYHNIVNDADGGYRSIGGLNSLSGLYTQAKNQYIDLISVYGIEINTFLNIALILGFGFALYMAYEKFKWKIEKMLAIVSFAVMTAYVTWHFFASTMGAEKQGRLMGLEKAGSVFFVLAVGAFSLILAHQYAKFQKTLLIYFSLLLVTAPLLMVSPIGGRNFFLPYVLQILLLCEVLSFSIEEEKMQIVVRACRSILRTACFLLFIGYFYIYMRNTQVANERLQYIREQVAAGETQIEVPMHPFESFLWNGKLQGIWETRYKIYYGIPDEIVLTHPKS